MNVVITGGTGFLGWHTACRLRALHGVEPIRLGREESADLDRLATAVTQADVVLHLAGVNRAETEAEVLEGNIDLATSLASAIKVAGHPMRVVYANSIHAGQTSAYGRGKAAAAEILGDALSGVGGSLSDVSLPNLFGEHGRPDYNSFVATFCHLIAEGGTPKVVDDRDVPLMHVQDGAAALIEAMSGSGHERTELDGDSRRVSDVLAELQEVGATYARGEMPPLDSPFSIDLFNTYRSYTFPAAFPIHPQVYSDARGDLVEAARSHGGTGQVFASTTLPGQTRGDHYHLRKVERFFVLRGTAEIALRRLLHDDVVTFRLDGSRPGFVDMPTMWVHNITNVGEEELVTMFWTNQLLDPENPDQFPERVRMEAA